MAKAISLDKATRDFQRYIKINDRVSQYTILSGDKCRMIYCLARSIRRLDGDVAELGVYRGGISMMLALALPHKRVHAFDTFRGICNATDIDRHRNGDFSDISPDVIRRLKQARVVVHEGYFPDTVKELSDGQRFCLCHFDGDTYQSAKDFLQFFYPRIVCGGVLVFDDYQWRDCPGVEKALNEFLCDKPEHVTSLVPFQCYIRKESPHEGEMLGWPIRGNRNSRRRKSAIRIRGKLRL